MGKGNGKANKMNDKKHRIFNVRFPSSFDFNIEGDEVSNIDGVLEIYKDERLVAIIREFLYVIEVTEEKTNE